MWNYIYDTLYLYTHIPTIPTIIFVCILAPKNIFSHPLKAEPGFGQTQIIAGHSICYVLLLFLICGNPAPRFVYSDQ